MTALMGLAPGGRFHGGPECRMKMTRMRDLGAKVIRWYPTWSQVQPSLTSSERNWGEPDEVIGLARELGLQMIVGVSSRGDHQLYDAVELGAIGRYAAEVADRYRDVDIRFIEGPNEPFSTQAGTNQTAEGRVALLRAVYEGVKGADASRLVSNGGHVGSVAPFEGIYALDGQKYFDILAFHAYTHPLSPVESRQQETRGYYALHEIRKLMRAKGDRDKKIAITEYGSATKDAGKSTRTEAQQARDLQEAYDLFVPKRWADCFCWFCAEDSDSSTAQGAYMGLMRSDGSVKPAGDLFKELAA